MSMRFLQDPIPSQVYSLSGIFAHKLQTRIRQWVRAIRIYEFCQPRNSPSPKREQAFSRGPRQRRQ